MNKYSLLALTAFLSLILNSSLLAEHPSRSSEHPSRSKAEHPTDHKDNQQKAELLGILFYADWCGSCKVLDPKLQDVKTEFAEAPVQFLRMDMTNDATKAKSAEMAESMGLSEIFQTHEGQTGFMLLVDADTHKMMDRLTHKQDKASLKNAISTSLTRAQSHKKSTDQKREHPSSPSEHPTSSEHPQ